jgi:hypothetical protein
MSWLQKQLEPVLGRLPRDTCGWRTCFGGPTRRMNKTQTTMPIPKLCSHDRPRIVAGYSFRIGLGPG